MTYFTKEDGRACAVRFIGSSLFFRHSPSTAEGSRSRRQLENPGCPRKAGLLALKLALQRARGECRSLRLSLAMGPLETFQPQRHEGRSKPKSKGSAMRGVLQELC